MPFLDFQLRLSWKNAGKWFFLLGLSVLYARLVRLWLYMYHIGIRQGKSVDSPVISIGNITVGGTGKTPMIDWFLDFCEKEDINVAILSRGYKAKRRSE